MRNVFLFSLPLTVIVVAGCGSQPKEQPVASNLERDLTLVTKDRDRAVASPLELGEVRTQQGNSVSSHRLVQAVRHRPAHHATVRVAVPAPSAPTTHPVLVDVSAPSPAAQPSAAAVPADSHELPPGKTVAVIPVSSGPSPSGSQRGPEDIPPVFVGGTGGSGMGGGGSGMGGGGSGMGGGGSGMGGGGSGMGGGGSGMGGEPIGISSYYR